MIIQSIFTVCDRIIATLGKQVKFHNDLLVNVFDPIKEEPVTALAGSSQQLDFAFPLLFFIFANTFGTYALGDDFSSFKQFFQPTYYTTNRYIFYHQMYPLLVCPSLYFIFIMATLITVAMFTALVLSPSLDSKYFLYLNAGGTFPSSIQRKQILSKIDTAKIGPFRAKCKRAIHCITVSFLVTFALYTAVHVYINGAFRCNWRQIVYWGLLLHPQQFYCIYAVLIIITNAVLVTRYIQIQQRTLLEEFSQLNCAFTKQLPLENPAFYWKHLILNRRLLIRYHFLLAYSHYWSPFLSVLFLGYIGLLSYDTYGFFFVRSLGLIQRALFLYLGSYGLAALFIVTGQCGSIVTLNERIMVENRRFFVLYSRIERKFNLKCLLKLEVSVANQPLEPYAFYLFGHYKLSSETFHAILSYLSIFFMMVFKNRL